MTKHKISIQNDLVSGDDQQFCTNHSDPFVFQWKFDLMENPNRTGSAQFNATAFD